MPVFTFCFKQTKKNPQKLCFLHYTSKDVTT